MRHVVCVGEKGWWNASVLAQKARVGKRVPLSCTSHRNSAAQVVDGLYTSTKGILHSPRVCAHAAAAASSTDPVRDLVLAPRDRPVQSSEFVCVCGGMGAMVRQAQARHATVCCSRLQLPTLPARVHGSMLHAQCIGVFR
jgi:hypothetical protein